MKYRVKKGNCFQEIELSGIDMELIGIVETGTGQQVYANDIIRLDGYFKDTIFWRTNRRSSGRAEETILKGYAIYKVVLGGELNYEKLEFIKCDHTYFYIPENTYTGKFVRPSIYDWKHGYKVTIIGTSHLDDINELIDKQKL